MRNTTENPSRQEDRCRSTRDKSTQQGWALWQNTVHDGINHNNNTSEPSPSLEERHTLFPVGTEQITEQELLDLQFVTRDEFIKTTTES